MQDGKFSRDEFLGMYKEDTLKLAAYISYFDNKKGRDVASIYGNNDKMKATISFPVYDPTLLNFIKEASETVFIEQNYPYFFTRNGIRSVQDELKTIEKADIMHMDNLKCIISKYVLGGRTKAYLWQQAVENGIFLAALKKAKDIVDFWDRKEA